MICPLFSMSSSELFAAAWFLFGSICHEQRTVVSLIPKDFSWLLKSVSLRQGTASDSSSPIPAYPYWAIHASPCHPWGHLYWGLGEHGAPIDHSWALLLGLDWASQPSCPSEKTGESKLGALAARRPNQAASHHRYAHPLWRCLGPAVH